ncbi:MAG: sodium:solute symporter [Planctomycetota bacterium]
MLILLFAFVLVQLLVAVWAMRRVESEDDFLVAGRRLGPTLAGASIFATWFGAESCVGAAGTAYEEGFSWASPEPFAYGLCLVLSGLLFTARLWRLGITTMADFFARRFGRSTELLSAALLLPASLLWAAAQVRAFGHVVAINSDGLIGPQLAIAIAAAIAIAYTVTGGLLADVYTDVLQCGALVLGLVVLGIAVWINLPDAVTPLVPATAPLAAAASPDAGWLQKIDDWAIPIFGSIVAQEVISRSLAARSPAVARGAAIGGGIAYVVIGAIPLAIGAVGPRFVTDLGDAEGILPHLAAQLLPTALNLVFCGALIAAILSTVDSCLLVVSSLIARNLSPRRDAGSQRLGLARWAVVGAGLVAWWLATSDLSVHDLVEEAAGFGSAGVFVLACTGLFGSAGRGWAANLCLFGGLAVWILCRHLLAGVVAAPYLASLLAAALAFAVGAALDRRHSAAASGQ